MRIDLIGTRPISRASATFLVELLDACSQHFHDSEWMRTRIKPQMDQNPVDCATANMDIDP